MGERQAAEYFLTRKNKAAEIQFNAINFGFLRSFPYVKHNKKELKLSHRNILNPSPQKTNFFTSSPMDQFNLKIFNFDKTHISNAATAKENNHDIIIIIIIHIKHSRMAR